MSIHKTKKSLKKTQLFFRCVFMSFYGLKMWRKTLKIGVFRGVLAVGNDICRLSVKKTRQKPVFNGFRAF